MTSQTIRPVGVLDELRRIVPTEQIEPHYDIEQNLGGSFAVEPASKKELVELLQWANERECVVYTRHPRSGDAERCGPRPRIYLRGRRMARVQDVDIVSGTVTVQSGIAMSELHRLLEERAFTTGFPSRPWRKGSLGAVLSASLDAHWGPPYGTMENQVLSLGVVLPDGTPVETRPAPRKAVGPDFDRLFLGSRGRFGIIHQVTLRVYQASTRLVLTYAASDLAEALRAIRLGFERGLDPRAVEILTPAPDRSWGRKRVGLTEDHPVLVLVEPWGRQSGVSGPALDEHMAEVLRRLEPPVGWDIHEGLLPPPREWKAPVVGVPWAALEEMARDVGRDIPAGLWLVRMSRHGAWVSIADSIRGEAADRVRRHVDAQRPPSPGPWAPLWRAMKEKLDPKGVLNPE
ncbi:MAG: FAD-binding oxidoreductase [Myxococcota bacterium]